mmetsp:Transcript_3608/g.9070  ORF Transcript_3608/g.9070 Transcript_3608/m.9070 type:complete len:102 (+) Transcript_3608:78-383(+)
MSAEGPTAASKKRKTEDDDKIGEKATKWADEFDKLDEDDQYTYLEEIAPHMSRMHMQFLQGIIGFDDDDDDEGNFDDDADDDDEEDGDDDEEDGAAEDAAE